jgi:hypothetical protein
MCLVRARDDETRKRLCRNRRDFTVDLVLIRSFRWAHPGIRIKLGDIMGAYKGRVRLRQRKRRSAKDQRIKALTAVKRGTTPPRDAVEPKTAERLSPPPPETDEAAQKVVLHPPVTAFES